MRRSRFRFHHAALWGVCVLLAPSKPTARADALEHLGGDSVEIVAEQIEVDVASSTASLTGRVSLTKGALRVECPRIEVKYEEGPRVTWAKGTGGVHAELRGVRAEAPDAELDLSKHTLELRGGVRLTRGAGWLNADRATIEIATAKVTLTEVRGSIPVASPKP